MSIFMYKGEPVNNPEYIAGDGITIEDNTISVDTPVKPMTQAEYDVLPDEEKLSGALYVTPNSVYLPPTDNGAVPTGSVMAFLALTAPKGYLVCDGSEHSIAAYANLALFIKEQFGTSNYFGGDGATTFAVPDMRNLFLRGFHGEAEEQLSGEVGAKQEATVFPAIWAYTANNGASGTVYAPVRTNNTSFQQENADKEVSFGSNQVIANFTKSSDGAKRLLSYTSRPVNIAVLYCIKT